MGGGVGGLQAAVTASKRGHRVTLLEKTGELGGTINFTDQDEDKVDLRNFKNLLIREARESCPDIRMETPCSREILDEIKPDAVIIAWTGLESGLSLPAAGWWDVKWVFTWQNTAMM